MDSDKSPPMKIGRSEEHVPEELVEEILSKLPVKSVLRFKCVSKSRQSLIGSKHLIKTHLRNSTNNTCLPYHKVILLQYPTPTQRRGRLPKQYNLQSLLNDPSINPSPIATATDDDDQNYNIIVGCCNGLVCILEKPGHVMLWNPATRISMKLPIIHNREKQHHVIKLGFGWDESSGAYKVFVMVILFDPNDSDVSRLCYRVYSSKTNSWKTVELERKHSPFSFENWQVEILHWSRNGKFVSGKLHWYEVRERNIVSFDLKSEEFGIMEAPCKPKPEEGHRIHMWSLRLGEIGGCLCAVSDHRRSSLDVWVMKESWLKLATIPFEHSPGNNPFTLIFGKGGPNGEILLLKGNSTFFVYYPKDDKVFSATAKQNCCFYQSTHVYVESLVSPRPSSTLLVYDEIF